jgi:cytidylate kinase
MLRSTEGASEYEQFPLEDKIAHQLEQLRRHLQIKILIDGPGGVGKSTLNDFFAKDLKSESISTGDIYRAETHYLLQRGIDEVNVGDYTDEKLRQILLNFNRTYDDGQNNPWLIKPLTAGQKEFIQDIRTNPDINQNISALSARHPLRDIVDKYQRQVAATNDRVFLDGRDMWQVFGSQAGSDGIVLVHLDAADKALAKRSFYKQGQKDSEIGRKDLATALRRIQDRNTKDGSKERGQLLRHLQAKDKGIYDIVLDTTNMNENETYLVLLEQINQVLSSRQSSR